METTCNGTGTRIIDAELQCELPVGVLAFVIILVGILIALAISALSGELENIQDIHYCKLRVCLVSLQMQTI